MGHLVEDVRFPVIACVRQNPVLVGIDEGEGAAMAERIDRDNVEPGVEQGAEKI